MSDRDAKILDLYARGVLIKHTATEVGMAPNSVGQVLKRLGVERPSKPQKKIVGLDEDAVVAAYKSGLAVSAVAERFGVNGRTVRRIILARGLKLEGRRRHDGCGGTIDRNGGALARIGRRA